MEEEMSSTNNDLIMRTITEYSFLQLIKANNKGVENPVLDYVLHQVERALHSFGVNTDDMAFQGEFVTDVTV